jgi:hypothetical protein
VMPPLVNWSLKPLSWRATASSAAVSTFKSPVTMTTLVQARRSYVRQFAIAEFCAWVAFSSSDSIGRGDSPEVDLDESGGD